ncbi:hypothetical protein ACFY0N_00505 [Streptomyces vinaceus]|uniref:hypothetical protein n=1 Tax=Streptomyces vinaceus TaxID=1960 RepID=UPI0036A0C424
MTNHAPQAPAYQLPTGRQISTAAHDSLAARDAAIDRLGRVMAVVTAAAVRDILTDCDHDAGFDAAHVELTEGASGSLFPTGRYWTTSGQELTFASTPGVERPEDGIYQMSEWTTYLDDSTRDVWWPLVEELADNKGRPAYRFDLAKAAGLSLD